MEDRLISQLEECLAAIEAGVSIESCLARYPDEADELAPLLSIALELARLPQPGPSSAQASTSKTQLLTEAERRRAQINQRSIRQRLANAWTSALRGFPGTAWPAPVRALATATLALALILLIGGGAVYAASDSLPGDPLYAIKLLGEDVQRTLSFSQDRRIRLEEAFNARRLDEVRQLLDQARQEQVLFGGLLREQSGNTWQVDDISVTVDADTRVQAEPTLNAFIEIHGVTQTDGTVLALVIELEEVEIVGLVEGIGPTGWQVAGQQVQVDDLTHSEEQLQVGDCVKVHARRFSSGTLLGIKIERSEGCSPGAPIQDRDSGATRTPAPSSAEPSQPTVATGATVTPEPTETSEPSETAKPTRTLEPTKTPRPTETPKATRTQESTETREPTETPKPTKTQEPTDTPRPTETREPPVAPQPPATVTPEPSDEPEPTEEPDSTEEPEPTDEPEPTEEPEPTDEPDD